MGRKILPDEVEHVAQELLDKGFQGNEGKRGLCMHLARIATNALIAWGDEQMWQQAKAAVQAEKVDKDPMLVDDGGIDPPNITAAKGWIPVLGEPEEPESVLVCGELAQQFHDLIAPPPERKA